MDGESESETDDYIKHSVVGTLLENNNFKPWLWLSW